MSYGSRMGGTSMSLSSGLTVVPSRSGSYSRVLLEDQCHVRLCQWTGVYPRFKVPVDELLDEEV